MRTYFTVIYSHTQRSELLDLQASVSYVTLRDVCVCVCVCVWLKQREVLATVRSLVPRRFTTLVSGFRDFLF